MKISLFLFFIFLISAPTKAIEMENRPTLEVFGIKINTVLDKEQVGKLISRNKHNNFYDILIYEMKNPSRETNLSKLFDKFKVVTALNLISNKEIVYEVYAEIKNCNNIFKIKQIMDEIDLSNEHIEIDKYVFNTAKNSRYKFYDNNNEVNFVVDVTCSDRSDEPYIYLSASYFKDDFFE